MSSRRRRPPFANLAYAKRSHLAPGRARLPFPAPLAPVYVNAFEVADDPMDMPMDDPQSVQDEEEVEAEVEEAAPSCVANCNAWSELYG